MSLWLNGTSFKPMNRLTTIDLLPENQATTNNVSIGRLHNNVSSLILDAYIP